MDSKERREVLAREKKKVTDLRLQREALQFEFEGRQAKRSEAVKALAMGDESKSKEIAELDKQIAGIAQRIEGLQLLIAEAEEATKKAEDDLQAVLQSENEEMQRAYQTHEREYLTGLAEEAPALVEETAEAYCHLTELLGRLYYADVLTAHRRENHDRDFGVEINDARNKLHATILNRLDREGLKPLMERGFKVIPEIVARWKDTSGAKTLSMGDVVHSAIDQMKADFSRAWRQERGL